MRLVSRHHAFLARGTHLPTPHLVAEAVGSLASTDAATAFLPPRELETAKAFLVQSRHNGGKEPWPESLVGMPTIAALYNREVQSTRLVWAYIELVVHKVERLQQYYTDAGELGGEGAPAPSEDDLGFYSNPVTSGAMYYTNKMRPLAKVHPCPKRDTTQAQLPTCTKQVFRLWLLTPTERTMRVRRRLMRCDTAIVLLFAGRLSRAQGRAHWHHVCGVPRLLAREGVPHPTQRRQVYSAPPDLT